MTADDIFSGDDYTRCALSRAEVFIRYGEVDWFRLA